MKTSTHFYDIKDLLDEVYSFTKDMKSGRIEVEIQTDISDGETDYDVQLILYGKDIRKAFELGYTDSLAVARIKAAELINSIAKIKGFMIGDVHENEY